MAQLEAEPVTVHVVPGVEGNVCMGRALGHSLGTNQWASWVDCDDEIRPGLYSNVLEVINTRPDVQFVGVNEAAIGTSGEFVFLPFKQHRLALAFHHGLTYNRAAFPGIPEYFANWGMIQNPPFVVDMSATLSLILAKASEGAYLDYPGYLWHRDNPDSYTHQRAGRPIGPLNELELEVLKKAPILHLYERSGAVTRQVLSRTFTDYLSNNEAAHAAVTEGTKHDLFRF